MRVSADYLHELIQGEIDAGIASERIVLGGFSQGGAMALFAGLTAPQKLGGIVGMSSWLVLSGKFEEEIKKENKGHNGATKVFMGHGSSDPLVRVELGTMTAGELKRLGFDVKMEIYP